MKRVVGVVAAAVFVSVFAETTALAASFRIRVEDVSLGTGVTLTDNAGGDLNPVSGAVTHAGSVGPALPVIVSTGTSAPLIGGVSDFGQLNLNTVAVATSGATLLRITLEMSDFVGPAGMLEVESTIAGVLTAPPGSSLEVQSWANGGNVSPALGPDAIGPLGAIGGVPAGSVPLWGPPAFSASTGAFGSTSSAVFDNGATDTFSLFLQVLVGFSAAGSVSFDTNVTVTDSVAAAVPEPASLLLVGTGIAACLLSRRKRCGTQS